MLTMVGYCVSLGNLLRFPYICNRNGGGAFLIPFILLLLITGFPTFFLESIISQFSGKGAKQVWSFCPLFQGIGVGAVVVTCSCMSYYNLYLAWPIYYMAHLLHGEVLLQRPALDNLWQQLEHRPVCGKREYNLRQ
ncbi:sodium- and chloride-dependent creatine transporter 1-like [Haliotis rubra]|uniref:sodium- and chloride-dependent creatine transporter 1-like n=1 Tax=Haliotis rubra TaxID=36100 RepID=UPI001EE5CA55|nr:sodium- and chloride-dependent creatine transporter 1-like [Haliotis rubra]